MSCLVTALREAGINLSKPTAVVLIFRRCHFQLYVKEAGVGHIWEKSHKGTFVLFLYFYFKKLERAYRSEFRSVFHLLKQYKNVY